MISMRRRAQLGLAATFFVLCCGMTTLLVVPRLSRPVAVADEGTNAPDFQLNDSHGRLFTLSKYRGNAVVLYFTAQDEEQTSIYYDRVDQLARRYAADARVKFFAVHSPLEDSFNPAVEDAARVFPTLVDQKGIVATRYSAKQTPLIVVIDPAGVVRYRGPFDDNADLAFSTRSYAAEVLGGIMGAPTGAFAQVAR